MLLVLTTRTLLLPVSEMYMTPLVSTNMKVGLLSVALRAGPPSPLLLVAIELPVPPVPATVTKIPEAKFHFRMMCCPKETMKRLPLVSPNKPTGMICVEVACTLSVVGVTD